MVIAETDHQTTTRYRLLETLRQYGEGALTTTGAMTTMRDRHLAHYLDRAEYWYAGQTTAHEAEANRAFAANWDNLRAAFDWALANHHHRDVADLLHTTYWYAVHTGQWEHHQWAPRRSRRRERHRVVASAAVVLWAGLAGESAMVEDVLATLEPSAPDLLPRDVEVIWQARAATAFMTNDLEGIQRATSWMDEREPRCDNPITEAWTCPTSSPACS